ncbi:copper transporter [Nonomuraea sp. NN258]|uniref:copper transporter n=1 Tax=Nonomuraea antri TaxID=2730852 RepID=UPI001569484D|nr:copper transporter [Nonomuraea antri]NRQ40015.1 copper transporter [Nonomuraea antri]
MIDFRYHLVSIVAIFLALAVGIVMGTTLLQDPAIVSAEKVSDDLTKANTGLRSEIDVLRGREAGNNEMFTVMTPDLVKGTLTGQRVLLIDTPGSSTGNRDAEQQVLTQAGATISGRIALTDKYLDPQRSGVLDGLVNQLKPVDMVFPPTSTAYDRAATLLAAALVTTDETQAGTANPATTAVLTGFEAGGLITTDGDPSKRATMAVMFAPEKPFEGENAELQAGALVSLVTGLDIAGKGTVLTGTATNAAVTGGAITALRDSGEAARRVSTVDTLDMPAGRVVIVYSLREQLSGRAGQYGIGADASAFLPALPSPSPTASPTSTSSGS